MYDLKVSLENIIPLTYARDHFSTIVTEVQRDKLYILTKGGKPAVAIIDVRYLEQLTGGEIKKDTIKEEINKNPEQVGLPKMVEHTSMPKPATPLSPIPHPAPTPPPSPPSYGNLKFKPTPPPPFQKSAPEETPAPKPFIPPTSTPLKPATPPPPPPPVTPTPAPAKPATPAPTPITPQKPVTPPAPTPGSSLILPDEDKSGPTIPSSTPAVPAPEDKDPNIEVQFTNENADLDGGPKPAKEENKRLDPDDQAPAAQYKGEESDEPEEMALD